MTAIGTATYSPDDNKLRLSPFARLDPETYERVKAAGFSWAPRQKVFVAGKWTPGREDLLTELCGEIGDEDTTLAERAEDRAERFEGYQERRTQDAETAQAGAARIMDGIPMGQPILIGHHSERHARKDAQRIESGLRKAVKMWETASYWKGRAAGAIAHAKYKELPAVRARRIKGIETDLRRMEREDKERAAKLAIWSKEGITLEQAQHIANYTHFTCTTEGSQGGGWSAWDVLRPDSDRYAACPSWTVEQVRAKAIEVYSSTGPTRERWRAHYNNRLTYEHAMLEEQGATALLAPKPRRDLMPLLNYRAVGGSITTANPYGGRGNETVTYPQIEMTKAEYAGIPTDYKGARLGPDRQHRFRTAMRNHSLVSVFLIDSKAHPAPTGEPAALPPPPVPDLPARAYAAPEADPAAAARAALKAGVVVAVAPQLFPTPRELAERMATEAAIEPGHHVLEPSAGTGRLLGALGCRMFGHNPEKGRVVAVEINGKLADGLRREFPLTVVHARDFLEFDMRGETFDRIVMNPPFADGADIKHILHARSFLKPGGRLVAICANGPRQRAKLLPIVEESGGTWEDLPAGSFKDAGTDVNTALLVIEAAQ